MHLFLFPKPIYDVQGPLKLLIPLKECGKIHFNSPSLDSDWFGLVWIGLGFYLVIEKSVIEGFWWVP